MDYTSLIREDLRKLKPYLPDRYRFQKEEPVWVDSNENPYSKKWGRYPNPNNQALKEKIAEIRNISAEEVFLSNGSDEAIDLIIRTFCLPGKDAITVINPVFEMYSHAARISAVGVNAFQMTAPYQPGLELADKILANPSKVLFLCSPNNPTGNSMPKDFMQHLLNHWPGILVIDEAYIDFSSQNSYLQSLAKHSNLIILQTFSKAFGLAGLRIGMTLAQKWIIDILESVKMPFNISQSSSEIALTILEKEGIPMDQIAEINSEKAMLAKAFSDFSFIKKVYPSDANFLLMKCADSKTLYHWLLSEGIYVRLRKDAACAQCIRVTVGTPEENKLCLNKFSEFENRIKTDLK